jgi:HAD superfamily hydrolase (TIGR01549 family)
MENTMHHWKAILFDLDGTLLDNNMEVFAMRFFERLAGKLGHLVPVADLVARAMQSTRDMASHDGTRTNEEVFAAAFYAPGILPREVAEPLLRDFYESEYPSLQKYTTKRPEAREVIEQASKSGCDVVLATNPVFPKSAIYQRMVWAGVQDLPFKWVTTYENSRSAKPNPRYFSQLLAQIGRSPNECLMVGDEAGDMVAATLGCETFLVPSATTKLTESTPTPTHKGSLQDLLRLLSS